MKEIKLIALLCCCSLFLFSGCNDPTKIELENCLNTALLKQMHYQQALAILKNEDTINSPLNERLIALNDDLITEINWRNLAYPDSIQYRRLECCDAEPPPVCVLKICYEMKLFKLNCLTSDLEIEEFGVFDLDDVPLGEISKDGLKQTRGGLFYYPIKYNAEDLPRRYYISFIEKGNPIKYKVEFVEQPK